MRELKAEEYFQVSGGGGKKGKKGGYGSGHGSGHGSSHGSGHGSSHGSGQGGGGGGGGGVITCGVGTYLDPQPDGSYACVPY